MADIHHTELTGRVAAVVWQAEDGSASIARLSTGQSVKGPTDGGLQAGMSYRFFGKWERHERFGPQFVFATYGLAVPHDKAGVVAYLTAVAENVGEARARKLWETFGPDAVKVLRERPEEVADRGVMSLADAKEASQTLHDESAFEAVKIDLLGLFAGRGFQAGKLIRECIRLWGGRAPEVVRRNPYTLMLRRLVSAGFNRCDKLFLDLGGRPARLKRQTLCAWHALRTDSSGHTWFPARTAGQAIAAAVPDGADPVRALRLGIRAKVLTRRKDDAGSVWVAEAGKAANEARLADRIKELSTWTPISRRTNSSSPTTTSSVEAWSAPPGDTTPPNGATEVSSTLTTSTNTDSPSGPGGGG